MLDNRSIAYHVNADLIFDTVSKQRESLHAFIAEHINFNTFIVSFAEVKRNDSAGLAFMVDALRLGKQLRKTICFEDIPEQMIAMIHFYNLSSLFIHSKTQEN